MNPIPKLASLLLASTSLCATKVMSMMITIKSVFHMSLRVTKVMSMMKTLKSVFWKSLRVTKVMSMMNTIKSVFWIRARMTLVTLGKGACSHTAEAFLRIVFVTRLPTSLAPLTKRVFPTLAMLQMSVPMMLFVSLFYLSHVDALDTCFLTLFRLFTHQAKTDVTPVVKETAETTRALARKMATSMIPPRTSACERQVDALTERRWIAPPVNVSQFTVTLQILVLVTRYVTICKSPVRRRPVALISDAKTRAPILALTLRVRKIIRVSPENVALRVPSTMARSASLRTLAKPTLVPTTRNVSPIQSNVSRRLACSTSACLTHLWILAKITLVPTTRHVSPIQSNVSRRLACSTSALLTVDPLILALL